LGVPLGGGVGILFRVFRVMASLRVEVGSLRSFLNHPLVRSYGLFVSSIFLSLVLLWVGARSAWMQIQALKLEQSLARQTLSSLTTKVGQLEALTEDWAAEELDSRFESFDRAVPSESSIPALLTEIQAIAQKCGAGISSLQFSESVSSEESTSRGWEEVRLNFTSTSSFAVLQSLLQTMEVASRVIDVETIQFSTGSDTGTGTADVQTTMVLISYYTPEPVLQPETPITFSPSGSDFIKASMILNRFTPYEVE